MYDLEEQEKIDALKAWWKQYGAMVIAAVIAFIGGVGGIQGWQYYQRSQAEQASILFSTLEEAVAKNDANEIRNVSAELIERFGRTAYAGMAGMIAGKVEHDAGNLEVAAERLEWVVEHARSEPLRALARLRLAGVRLDQKQHDAALRLLDAGGGEAFTPLYADLRGDVLMAQGKTEEAVGAYDKALETTPEADPWRNVIQVKRDAVGSLK